MNLIASVSLKVVVEAAQIFQVAFYDAFDGVRWQDVVDGDSVILVDSAVVADFGDAWAGQVEHHSQHFQGGGPLKGVHVLVEFLLPLGAP